MAFDLLVKNGMIVDGPNQLWVSDITYLALPARFAYVAIILDVISEDKVMP